MTITDVESPPFKRMARPTHCPVLIVEDDEDLREMMAQLLTLEGFQTATVANGQEALAYLHASARPEVILLDLMMPVMDGWEFRRRQQADPDLAGVPVIVLSALDQTRAAKVDAVAFPEKAARLRSPPRIGSQVLPLIRLHFGGAKVRRTATAPRGRDCIQVRQTVERGERSRRRRGAGNMNHR